MALSTDLEAPIKPRQPIYIKPPKDTILIQAASGIKCIEMLQLTQGVHEAYCKKWGIEARIVAYPHDLPVDGRHPMWVKVHLIREALEQGWKKVIWLDADTLIVDDTVDLRDAVSENVIGATYHRMDWEAAGVGDVAYDHFCAGALYIPNNQDTRALVDEWWETDDENHPWHDQHSLNKLCKSRFASLICKRIDARWNSVVPFFISDKPVVKAWHGFGHFPERFAAMEAEMVKRGMIEATPEPIAIPFTPENAISPVLHTLEHARLMRSEGRLDEARATYELLLESDPYNTDIMYQLCEVLGALHQPEVAEGIAKRAIAHDPRNGIGYGLLAGCKSWRGLHEEAGELYQKALQLSPDMAMVKWNYALNLLMRGDYANGMHVYKWGQVAGKLRKRTLKPEWDGSRMDGKTLWLWAEQGFGDALQMVRFIPLLRQISGCAKVVLEVHKELVKLFIESGVADEVYEIQPGGAVTWDWDEHLGLMGIPGVIGLKNRTWQHVDLAGEPTTKEFELGVRGCDGGIMEPFEFAPYLTAEPLALPGDGMLKVGVCYRGSTGHDNDHNRSTPFALWDDLLKTAGCAFFNLDKQTSSLPLSDWAATARIIASLDLVITVDTAVAHLAGAMGKEVWILLPFVGDWRWGYQGSSTPWYPSAFLSRQVTAGDWLGVIGRTHAKLFSRAPKDTQKVLRAGWDGQNRTGHEEIMPMAEFAREADKIGRAGTTRHAQALYGLIKWLRPQTVVEVGTWHGYTGVWMARALQELGKGELYCIDDFSLKVGATDLEKLQQNIERCDVGGLMTVLVGKSTEVDWPERVDFAYIDGDHSLDGCKKDVDLAIERGAQCIVIHDTYSWWGPRAYVEKYLPSDYTMIECAFDEGLAILMKKAEKPPTSYTQEAFPTGAIVAMV